MQSGSSDTTSDCDCRKSGLAVGSIDLARASGGVSISQAAFVPTRGNLSGADVAFPYPPSSVAIGVKPSFAGRTKRVQERRWVVLDAQPVHESAIRARKGLSLCPCWF